MTTKKLAGIIAVAAIIAIGGYMFMTPAPTETETAVPVEQAAAPARIVQSEPAAGEEETASAPAEESAATPAEAADPTTINVEEVMKPRVLGADDAPVTIQEFASLTCSHCAHFHTSTFKQIKEEYVDTGKVRFIFTDFPLNTPARDASIVARCLPQDRYFKFIGFLMKTQDQWAFSADYQKSLLQNAKLLGGNGERLEACLQNDELKEALAARMQESATEYGIQSTPSFVINGEETIRGAQPFPVFKEKIDALLEESNATE